MLFTEDELDILIPAIDVYLEDDLPGFRSPNKIGLVEMLEKACDKLENMTALTHFSKQEFTLMAASLHNLMGNDETQPAEYVELLDKLFRLSDPEA